MITSGDIPFHLKEGLEESETPPPPSSDLPLMEQLDALEKFLVRQALKEAAGVQTRAADRLGISERALRYKLKKYGM